MSAPKEREPKCGTVTAVCRGSTHTFSKRTRDRIHLLAGLGVEGDAHMGVTVKHRSRVARDPHQPNLRQIHLIHAELLDELRTAGFSLSAGQVGENITTRGVDLLGLPTGTRLYLGDTAAVEVNRLTQSLRATRPFSARLDGGCARPRRAGRVDSQSGNHGYRPDRWRGTARRRYPRRVASRAASAGCACLI